MNNHRTSQKQARITLKYEMTSHFEKMTMNALATDKIQYKDVFDKDVATHVVTGIEYGVKAFFVFDRTVSENENVQDISGSMQIVIKKIPMVSIEGKGKLDMKSEEKELADSLQCTFIGDIDLDKLPITFQEALDIYKQLPMLIRGGVKPGEYPTLVVPQKASLLPLCKLDNKAAKLVREISASLVSLVQDVVQELLEMKMKVSDWQQTDECKNYFPGIKKQLSTFLDLVSLCITDIMKKIVTILPKIRGGGEEEKVIASVIRDHIASVFNHSSLASWMDEKRIEIDMLGAFIKWLSQCQAIKFALSPAEMNREIMQMDNDIVFCLMLTVPQNNDPNEQLKKMADHYQRVVHNDGPSDLAWYQDMNLVSKMKIVVRQYNELAKATDTEQENIKFIVSLSEPSKLEDCGAQILCYRNGIQVDFELPHTPKISYSVEWKQHDSIHYTIKLPNPPKNTSITAVLYQAKGGDRNKWSMKPFQGDSITLTGLKPDTEYFIKVRIRYGELLGVSQDSTIMAGPPVRTKKNVVKMCLKGNYLNCAGEYERTERKVIGRYVWVCNAENVKKFICLNPRYKKKRQWIIGKLSYMEDVVTMGKNKCICVSYPGADTPYEASWSLEGQTKFIMSVSMVLLAGDETWIPARELGEN